MGYQEYYTAITKPFFAPPEWVFGLAWGIIYPLIALAAVYILYLVYKKRADWKLFLILVLNMIGNIVFTPLQLLLPGELWASLDILFVLATVALLQWYAWRVSKLLFILLLPYLLWGTFATVLQITIFFLN